jgi:hypothetical protein
LPFKTALDSPREDPIGFPLQLVLEIRIYPTMTRWKWCARGQLEQLKSYHRKP